MPSFSLKCSSFFSAFVLGGASDVAIMPSFAGIPPHATVENRLLLPFSTLLEGRCLVTALGIATTPPRGQNANAVREISSTMKIVDNARHRCFRRPVAAVFGLPMLSRDASHETQSPVYVPTTRVKQCEIAPNVRHREKERGREGERKRDDERNRATEKCRCGGVRRRLRCTRPPPPQLVL